MSQVEPQILNVNEMYESCKSCERNKFRETTNACRSCVYDILRTKLESEQKAQKDYEKRQNK